MKKYCTDNTMHSPAGHIYNLSVLTIMTYPCAGYGDALSRMLSACSCNTWQFFPFYQLPPVLWSSAGLWMVSEDCREAKLVSLASVHHMCTAELCASCCWTIMLSDDEWLHIRCLNWRAAPSAKWFGKSGLAWWMEKVTMPISVTPADSLLLVQQSQSSISLRSTLSPSDRWDLLSLNCH